MYLLTAVFINTDLLIRKRIEILNTMANTIQYDDMHGKRVPLMSNWFYLTHLR